jgi:hypothetical protein
MRALSEETYLELADILLSEADDQVKPEAEKYPRVGTSEPGAA